MIRCTAARSAALGTSTPELLVDGGHGVGFPARERDGGGGGGSGVDRLPPPRSGGRGARCAGGVTGRDAGALSSGRTRGDAAPSPRPSPAASADGPTASGRPCR